MQKKSMNIEDLRIYCLSKIGTEEGFPFDQSTLVFKVLDKIFALVDIDNVHPTVNLKCNPEQAIEWREQYVEVVPGYHMNKKHWNTVDFIQLNDQELVKFMIDHSYDCVVAKMTKVQQKILQDAGQK